MVHFIVLLHQHTCIHIIKIVSINICTTEGNIYRLTIGEFNGLHVKGMSLYRYHISGLAGLALSLIL